METDGIPLEQLLLKLQTKLNDTHPTEENLLHKYLQECQPRPETIALLFAELTGRRQTIAELIETISPTKLKGYTTTATAQTHKQPPKTYCNAKRLLALTILSEITLAFQYPFEITETREQELQFTSNEGWFRRRNVQIELLQPICAELGWSVVQETTVAKRTIGLMLDTSGDNIDI